MGAQKRCHYEKVLTIYVKRLDLSRYIDHRCGVASNEFLNDLELRGLIFDSTDREVLDQRLSEKPITLYCGFDPTADSLHVGSLLPLLLLRRFQDAGHRVISLAGGATGMVGDPSGKSEERNLLDEETLSHNVEAIASQMKSFIKLEDGTSSATGASMLLNNLEWTSNVNVLDFLRDVGKHVTVGTMLGKESIRARLESDQGISFTEFSYMLLQANDFYEMYQRYDCEMQVGGSDQWGNITAGIDLIRRRIGGTAYGLTVPLITRSDGGKFGKTAEGTIWLDPKRTLPYQLHQYFLNTDDKDVEKMLLQLTLLKVEEIQEVLTEHQKDPSLRLGQRRLADEVCTLVHGVEEKEKAVLAAEILFGEILPSNENLEAVRGIIPETSISREKLQEIESLVNALAESGLCKSKGDARRTIKGGGVSVNGIRQDPENSELSQELLEDAHFILLQKGRRSRHLLIIS